MRSVALGFWIGTGSAAEDDDEAGLSHLIEHMLFRGTDALRLAGDRPDLRRDGRRAQRGHGQGDHVGLLARARRAPASGVRRHGRHGLAPALRRRGARATSARSCSRRSRCTRTTRRTRSSTSSARPSSATTRSGRAIIGRRRGRRRRAARRAARASTPRATCPATSSSRRPARSTTTRSSSSCAPPGSRAARRDGARRCRRRRRPTPPRGALRRQGRPSSTTSASARPGIAARRRAPLRAARARQRPRRDVVVAAVPGGPRAARPGLRRLLVPRRCTPGTGQVGLYLGTRPDNVARGAAASSADELERLRRGPGARADELAALQGERQGPHRAVAGVDDGADEPARLVGAGRHAAADASTRSIERIDAVTLEDVARARRASCSRPSA